MYYYCVTVNRDNIISDELCTTHACITCTVESISLIATYTAAVVTSNGVDAVSIFITVIEATWLTLINILAGREKNLYNCDTEYSIHTQDAALYNQVIGHLFFNLHTPVTNF